MNKIVKNPSSIELQNLTQDLIYYETAVTSSHGSSSISYNAETNMYEYSANLGSESKVSLYSTNDVLRYHFEENLDDVLKSGDIYILKQNSGYDIIVYKGQLLGYGATDNKTTRNAFKTDGFPIIKDLAKEYVSKYFEEHAGFLKNIAFSFSESGIKIYSTINNTDNESSYDTAEFVDLFISFDSFSPWQLNAISGVVLDDFKSVGLSLAGKNYLTLMLNDLMVNETCNVDPDWFIKLLTGYDEYYEEHGTGGLKYDGVEVKISLDEVLKIQMDRVIENDIPLEDNVMPEAGMYSSDEIIGIWENTSAIDNFSKRINKIIKTVASVVNNARTTRYDPLIFDLDNDGFNVETKENGANFDLDKNGLAEKINWTKKDGILCLDLNGNGTIDDGGEVFGDQTLIIDDDGTTAKNGFEALAQYDINGDGVIDADDEIFSQLRIWVDADGNGISGDGELKTLSELGIVSINLKYTNVNAETGTEALIGNTATFTRADGTTSGVGELWVSADFFDTVDKLDVEIPDDIAELPNIKSIGNVYSLHSAMALDDFVNICHSIAYTVINKAA